MKIKVDDLKKLEIFNNISSQTISKVISESDVKEYKAGEILFEDKEDVSTIYSYKNN